MAELALDHIQGTARARRSDREGAVRLGALLPGASRRRSPLPWAGRLGICGPCCGARGRVVTGERGWRTPTTGGVQLHCGVHGSPPWFVLKGEET